VNPEQRYDSYERTQFNPEPERVKMATDLDTTQIFVHSAVERLSDDILKDWFVDLRVTPLIYEIEIRAISKDRKSRAEAMEVYKEQPQMQGEQKPGVLSTLLGRR
jgi:hypothetical protein